MDDLDADFRHLYGIAGVGEEEFGALSSRRFIALAERTFCYEGTMAALAALEQKPAASEEVQPTRAGIAADPVLGPLFDV